MSESSDYTNKQEVTHFEVLCTSILSIIFDLQLEGSQRLDNDWQPWDLSSEGRSEVSFSKNHGDCLRYIGALD